MRSLVWVCSNLVLVIADHEIARTVRRFSFAFAVDDLHVDARELNRRLAADAAFDVVDVRQELVELCQLGRVREAPRTYI